jgi:hypothetical protein
MSPTIKFLSDVRDGLEHVDYDLIYQSIADLKDKFVPSAKLKKGFAIERVRINRPGQTFSGKAQLSYINDKVVLERLSGYGRANLPRQAVFYGSIISKQIPQPRVAAYFETSELIKSLSDTEDVKETFTLSRWRVQEDIEVIEMIFSDEALKVNEYVQMSLEHQLKKISDHPLRDHCIEQGKFFSNEYARTDVRKGEEHKYKITAAYANYIWSRTGLKGITYPSVPTEYKGQNVALLPEVVDRALKLELVGEFNFAGRNEKNLVTLGRYCKDFGVTENDFQWLDYKDDVAPFE